MPPVRHAPAGAGQTRLRTSAAPIHVVLHRPDDLLRDDVFLAAAQHQLSRTAMFKPGLKAESAGDTAAANAGVVVQAGGSKCSHWRQTYTASNRRPRGQW